jgi:polysaccharide biosynthesis/export protein
MPSKRRFLSPVFAIALSSCLSASGCKLCSDFDMRSSRSSDFDMNSVVRECSPGFFGDPNAPRELAMVPHPGYVIESPDILLIDAIRMVPKPPYRIAPLDSVVIQVTDIPAEEPINALFTVEADGTVNLGYSYGSVFVSGKTLPGARAAIEELLKSAKLKDPHVRVSMGQTAALQQIRGEHLVRPDGTVSLGKYGSVQVSGLLIEDAKKAIEAHLARFLLDPEVSVDVGAYNSKTYYIVTDGGGFGEQVYRFPSTGKETVLDALSQINGLPIVACKRRIWIARPTPAGACYKVLPIDWMSITRLGTTATNYQVLPGDRIFVEANPLISADTALARLLSPIERILGVTLLGSSTVHSIAIPLGQTGLTGF